MVCRTQLSSFICEIGIQWKSVALIAPHFSPVIVSTLVTVLQLTRPKSITNGISKLYEGVNNEQTKLIIKYKS